MNKRTALSICIRNETKRKENDPVAFTDRMKMKSTAPRTVTACEHENEHLKKTKNEKLEK